MNRLTKWLMAVGVAAAVGGPAAAQDERRPAPRPPERDRPGREDYDYAVYEYDRRHDRWEYVDRFETRREAERYARQLEQRGKRVKVKEFRDRRDRRDR